MNIMPAFLITCDSIPHRLIHLIITIAFNLLVMLSIEYTIGWIRVVLIYMGSGVCGSLASAIFVPYHVEVRIPLIIPLVNHSRLGNLVKFY